MSPAGGALDGTTTATAATRKKGTFSGFSVAFFSLSLSLSLLRFYLWSHYVDFDCDVAIVLFGGAEGKVVELADKIPTGSFFSVFYRVSPFFFVHSLVAFEVLPRSAQLSRELPIFTGIRLIKIR